jgi:rhodanese-related sulfurtransferase
MADTAPTSAAELLAEARARLDRLSPVQASEAMASGALLIDIRSDSQRESDGVIPGARFIARNVLEWRCDPACEWSDPEAVRDLSRQLIVVCNEGYQSSLAAATLKRFGFERATDLIGGFQAWRDAGFPVQAAEEQSLP